MANIYDINGNVIQPEASVSDEQIRDAFLHAVADGSISIGMKPGDTLTIDTSYFNQAYMQTAYSSLLQAYKEHPNSVPFFLNTDQHGRGLEIQRYGNNIDVDGLEYASINNGDTVVDTYGSEFLEETYERIKFVKNYIGVVGNHEHKPSNSEDPEKAQIRRTFCTTNLDRRMISTSETDCYVAYQQIHAVKYICIDPYITFINTGSSPSYNGALSDWLIEELSRNDGNDIVVLQHEPQWLTYKTRDDIGYTESTGQHDLFDLLLARKNKTSGTFTDSDNITHSFDFSDTQGDILCMLSGHWHEERYSDNDGFTVYAADWEGGNKYGGTFGLIDRESNLLRIFSFDNINGVRTELDLSLQ